MEKRKSPKGFIVVLLGEIIEIPQDSDKSWRSKKITLKQVAAACNMPVDTFYGKARKFENVA